MKLTLEAVAALTGGKILSGDPELTVFGVASLLDASREEASFLGNEKYFQDFLHTSAGIVLVPPGLPAYPEHAAFVEVDNPSMAFNALVKYFMASAYRFTPGIHPTAIIDPTASFNPDKIHVGAYTCIGAHCIIGDGVTMGENCRLHAHVTIRERCKLGNRVTIQPGAVIGSDGFGFLMGDNGRYVGIDQVGIVELGDDVDVGANTTIDRARFGRTIVGEGTKIDNLIQLGHNVVVGRHCIIVAQSGIAGSTKVGDYATIAAQVGTGIIVGVAGAILTGGPGAVFWMWVISFFGMATIYAEATLAQETRIVELDGTIKGGPVYYITTAFKGKFGKFLAGFFAVAITLALGFMGCMVQSNSIGATMETAFGIPSWVVGIVLIVICAFIFLGGVQRLASVTEKVVPLMAAVFLFGGLIVLVVRIKYIPETFAMIFRYAFEPQAIVGGGFGYAIKLAISQGAKRGLFSNEAGMGSTPHAHALANVKNPHEQGTVAIIGVFIDMFVILTLNALVIISTLYAGDGPLAGCGAAALSSTFNKTNLAQCAFGTVFGYKAGSMFVAICLFFFAFSTILSWNLFGKINMVYLFGKKSASVYTLLALIFIFLGTTMSNDLVWELSDMLNQLMVIPNAIALLALTSHVVKHSHTPDRLSGRENG